MTTFHLSDLSWNWLSPTVHMLLHHGVDIIRNTPVAPGLLSEEPSEHSNKKIREIKAHHACKYSIEANLKDIFNRTAYCSDPVISNYLVKSLLKNKSKLPLADEVQSLLKEKMIKMIKLVIWIF